MLNNVRLDVEEESEMSLELLGLVRRQLNEGEGGYNGNKARDNSKRLAHQDDSNALVTMDEEEIDWSGYVEEDTQNFAMMAYSSSNSGSDNESVFMTKECDLQNTHVNDRYVKGMHTVPSPMTGVSSFTQWIFNSYTDTKGLTTLKISKTTKRKLCFT
nr:hypothetical protein [Tanacetum cinerariifolium]